MDLLIELFSEEIPARMQPRAREDLKRLITDGLVDAGLTYASAGALSTPRRLALAHPLDMAGMANPRVQLHRLHPHPSAVRTGRKIRRRRTFTPPPPPPQPDRTAASVRDFRAAAYTTACWRSTRSVSG